MEQHDMTLFYTGFIALHLLHSQNSEKALSNYDY